MSDNNGGSAFPVTPTNAFGQCADTQMGMSLRDYFAAKAMQSIYMRFGGGACAASNHDGGLTHAAESAYLMADAMLAAREAKS